LLPASMYRTRLQVRRQAEGNTNHEAADRLAMCHMSKQQGHSS